MPRKPQSGRRQSINVRRLHPRLAITAQLRPQVIDGDEEKVWLAVRASVGCACHEAADEDGKRTIHQILVKNKAKVVHGLEQQPCGVQVVEWVGLVASSFQFLLGLAAVFAEEVGDFRTLAKCCHI